MVSNFTLSICPVCHNAVCALQFARSARPYVAVSRICPQVPADSDRDPKTQTLDTSAESANHDAGLRKDLRLPMPKASFTAISKPKYHVAAGWQREDYGFRHCDCPQPRYRRRIAGHRHSLHPPYLAPEQIEGQRANEQTDIFSFGDVCDELLSGAHPFEKFKNNRGMLVNKRGHSKA
ncbi:MAG TPA: protein kinase [Bryobacteraceae bacterium]|nr:protein kinase [Bryobacteraceae bacterium]